MGDKAAGASREMTLSAPSGCPGSCGSEQSCRLASAYGAE